MNPTPQHDFLVGIDSDGCAFDTMEVKHKECFIPNTILHYHLQPISRFAREAAEFVNLYSKSRGVNRFPALIETLAWLGKRPDVRQRGIQVPMPQGLVDWIARETKLGNPALEAAVAAAGDDDLRRALAWSQDVNAAVTRIVHGVPPFPSVRPCLEKLSGRADMLVISATPNEALTREWQEHDLDPFVAGICGQESGTKRETLSAAAGYPSGQTLMIGDAPGDLQAAQANGTRFYPINPGAEQASWQRLHDEAIDRFLTGTFDDTYQQSLLEEFDSYLPEKPPWPVEE